MKIEAATLPEEKNAIQETQQCEGCGAVYPRMQGVLCGSCKVKTGDDAGQVGTHSVVSSIIKSVATHQSEASLHRLNRQPAKQTLNRGLLNASQARVHNQALKELSHTETNVLTGTLWIYPANGNKARAIQHPTVRYTVTLAVPVETAFRAFVELLQSAYMTLPVDPDEKEEHDRMTARITLEYMTFAVQKDNSSSYQLNVPSGSIGTLHNRLSQSDGISKKDAAGKSITLWVYVWEILHNAKRSRESDDDSGGSNKEDASPPSKRSVVENSYRRIMNISTRRTSLTSQRSVTASLQRSIASHVLTPLKYTSMYRPSIAGLSLLPSTPAVRYDAYPFERINWTIDKWGTISLIEGSPKETILVAKDWPEHKYQSKPRGGYLGRGVEKYAFKGQVGGADVAVFQINPIASLFIIQEDENNNMLRQGLKALVLADYFMKSFYQRAKQLNFDGLPRMRVNASGAFLGVINAEKILPCPVTGPDNRTLTHTLFLSTPLLLGDFRKYSGSLQTGQSGETGFGAAVDTFAHHVVVDSMNSVFLCDLQGFITNNEFILFDPQACITADRTTKTTLYDLSPANAIQRFLREHVCNAFCKGIQLPSTNPTQYAPKSILPDKLCNGPLRHGWD
ncbi:kinase-like domain-containing protein [Gautieria morchelliformis]|nr:kinase-like domain-containing protein [Gautieria morchelliformis]